MGERNGWGVVGEIVADMRSKLIDEGWFGRRPTEKIEDPLARLWGVEAGESETPFARFAQWIEVKPPPLKMEGHAPAAPKAAAQPSFEEAWALREPADGQAARDKEVGLEL